MFTKCYIIYLFVCVFHVQISPEAIINAWSSYSDEFHKINLTEIQFDLLYQCLASRYTEYCEMYLKGYNYTIFNVGPIKMQVFSENAFISHIPQYTCLFNTSTCGNNTYECSRTKNVLRSGGAEGCYEYDFIIQWQNANEYFKDDKLTNCSIIFNYVSYGIKNISLNPRNVSLSTTIETVQTTIYSSLMSSTIALSSTNVSGNQNLTTKIAEKDGSDLLLMAVILTSSLLFLSVTANLYMLFAFYRRTNTETHIYSCTDFIQQDVHVYEGTNVANDEQEMNYVNLRENNDVQRDK